MKTSVAIIEDNRDVREELRHLLDASPDFVCGPVCGDAEVALRVLVAARPELVLLDLQLPGKSGVDCLAILRGRLPETRFLIYSVSEESEHIFAAIQAGADGYLLKHTPPDAILAALRELREGGGPLSAPVGRRLLARLRGEDRAPEPCADPLTPRETEVLALLADGRCTKEIASRLDISGDTVNAHLKHIYQKLGVRSRVEAVLRFVQRAAPASFGERRSAAHRD